MEVDAIVSLNKMWTTYAMLLHKKSHIFNFTSVCAHAIGHFTFTDTFKMSATAFPIVTQTKSSTWILPLLIYQISFFSFFANQFSSGLDSSGSEQRLDSSNIFSLGIWSLNNLGHIPTTSCSSTMLLQ
eukprot:TRINITY_DN22919_c0_g1_i1.p1 TRINITY_DN22919_c0_g1~~TRINITY_DN22919_c0_g1_i1.p1  ORF type:complete len:128 (+),score=10.57 TRINITY_DN22919_c0_g1_i1:1493-1876(+)